MKKHNFYAGPSIMSQYTIDNTIEAIRDFAGTGLSILEISHRSKEFVAVMDEVQALFKELLDIPEGYEVIFVGGGASTQFCMVPYNLLKTKAAYIDSGTWAHKAIKEAKLFGEVDVLASSEEANYTYYPKIENVPTDVDYLHITTNNTIYGTELRTDPDVPVRMVADMSSDIFSRPIDVSKYDIIYGGAQKNVSPAGVTFAIVRTDALGKVDRKIPTMLNYETHIKKGSMFNTPPVVPIYCALETLRWIKAQGGVEEMARRAEARAKVLYDEIDRNKLFRGTVEKDSRSLMNICFVMNDEYKDLEKPFLEYATQRGMVGIKGHRSVGGFRASCYNAMPMEGVEALVKCMQDFEKEH
ncbi:MAG: 3-phosphoserine/phosphohydroxythreonine transaminase [Bacteroidales bacterium]|nr:3-phosphoserine/phosphohydroxythreonine transaminase [Bacteroidales bacterium]